MTGIKVTLDREVSRRHPGIDKIVRAQLNYSRLHEVISENLGIDPDVSVSISDGRPVAKFTDAGRSLPFAPGFYVIESVDQYERKQPRRLMQEIAACRDYLRDHIVHNMVPSSRGVPNLELLAEVLNVSNVQLDGHPPTADVDVRLSVEQLDPDNLYANERDVYQRLFDTERLSPGEVLKRYVEVIKMGLMLRIPDDAEDGESLARLDNELSPLLNHFLSVRNMIHRTQNKMLDSRSFEDTDSYLLLGTWERLMSMDYFSKSTIPKVNNYIRKMLQPNPNSFIAEPIHLTGIYVQQNLDDDCEDGIN